MGAGKEAEGGRGRKHLLPLPQRVYPGRLRKAVWQGVFAGRAERIIVSLPPSLNAKGSFLIRTSITLSICFKRIQLLQDGEVH